MAFLVFGWRCRDSNPGPDKATECFLHVYLLFGFSKSGRYRSPPRRHLIFCNFGLWSKHLTHLVRGSVEVRLPAYIGRHPGGTKSVAILDYAANAKLLSPFVFWSSFDNGVNNRAPTCLQTDDLSCRYRSSPKSKMIHDELRMVNRMQMLNLKLQMTNDSIYNDYSSVSLYNQQ